MHRDRDSHGHGGRYNEASSRTGGGSSRDPRQYPRNDHDYAGMYDEDQPGEDGYSRGQYAEDEPGVDNARYREYDDSRQRSRSRGWRNRSRSHSPSREAGRPSDTVILEGLPFSASSNELREIILNNSIAAEFPSIDVRVSSSRGYTRAFVQFQEVDHAVAFMKEHYPKLHLELPDSTDDVPEGRFDAYIHYARSRENRDDVDTRGPNGNNWICPSCDFSNYPTRLKCKVCGGPQAAPAWQQSLTGETDASDVPSHILVIYPLPAFVTEDMFASDTKKLELQKPEPPKDTGNGAPKLKSTAPTGDATGYGARPGSLHRVFVMRDVTSNESFKYGFAEFWTVEDAAAAVSKFRMSRAFTIAACPVTVSNIHMGVFTPEEREVTPDNEHMSFHPLFNPALRVRYRDRHLYPSQAVVTSQPPGGDKSSKSAEDASGDKKSKKRKAEGGQPGASTKKLVPMGGQMAKWQRKHDELRGDGRGRGNGDEAGPDDANLGQGGTSAQSSKAGTTGGSADEGKPQGPIKISLSNSIRLGPLAGGGSVTGPDASSLAAGTQSVQAEAPNAVSYVDRDRLMCLICMRKYKSVDEVDIHEKSRNHKNATENEEQVKAALPRLAARDKRLAKQAQETGNDDGGNGGDAGSQYRDRAKERRQAHNQPTKPAQAPQGKPKTKPVSVANASAIANTPQSEASAPPAKPAQSKGAGMLAKMGWSAGEGLGAAGEGRTEVIAQSAYQEGVGLGAEGGNLGDAAQIAERKTKNSYADYVNTVQDKARERYNKLD